MSEEAVADEANETESNLMSVDKIVDERGVPLGNVLKEVTRKLGRINEVNAKLDMLLQTNQVAQNSAQKAYSKASESKIDPDMKEYIDARFQEDKHASVEKAQQAALDTVFTTFPELMKSSDEFDQAFFNLAVEHEKSIDLKDPHRPWKAAQLAALELGKIEKITKAKVLQDDARRTRILSEGSAASKDTKQPKEPAMKINKTAVNRFFKIDPAKIEKYAKEQE